MKRAINITLNTLLCAGIIAGLTVAGPVAAQPRHSARLAHSVHFADDGQETHNGGHRTSLSRFGGGDGQETHSGGHRSTPNCGFREDGQETHNGGK